MNTNFSWGGRFKVTIEATTEFCSINFEIHFVRIGERHNAPVIEYELFAFFKIEFYFLEF